VRAVKKVILLVGALIAIALVWAVGRRHLPSDIEYQGEKIKLTKYYFSFEDYKDDPDNISPSENARVERLVTQAPIDRHFAGRKEMVRALLELKFPGYGLGFAENSAQPVGNVLELSSVEIPRADKNRYLVFEEHHGSYTLIDDFVAPSDPEIMQVREEKGFLIYSTRSGQRVLTRPVTSNDKE
jgi:hypothetical protein